MTSSPPFSLKLPRFLFINGPSGCGKSTLAHLIRREDRSVWHESFAEPIRQMIYSVFLPEQGPIDYEVDLRKQEVKNADILAIAKTHLQGELAPSDCTTVRQTMIDFSESFMKPRFGSDIFGRLLFKRCAEQELWYSHFIIDDSGFVPEAQYVISQVGPQNCVLARLHRANCNFRGDSRGYILLEGVKTIDLTNDSTPAALLSTLATALSALAPASL